MTISNSTIANNSSDRDGGGIFNDNGSSRVVNISNSTIANNSANGDGGGILNNGTTTISNSTIANNSANGGGGLFNKSGTMTIAQSIVANNSASSGHNCGFAPPLIDQGYNLESGTDCGFTATGSLQNTNPQIGPLANNGGPTRTMALQPTSPAINTIPPTICAITTDQRGVSRPQGPTCDMGAFEFQDTTAPTLHLPANITVPATGPQGATVTYTVTATDPDNASNQLTISCIPPSGSTFSIGTTTVHCTASDPASNSTSGSFQVTVQGAAAQISDLINLKDSFHLSKGLQKSLDAKLTAALKAVNAGKIADACESLTAFINEMNAQPGKGLTTGQATQLRKAAQQIQAVLGCSQGHCKRDRDSENRDDHHCPCSIFYQEGAILIWHSDKL
jgi:hypothetical protein